MNAILEQINSVGLKFVEFALPMLVQSVVLIVILLLADFALRKKVRAVFRYWIWLLVLVKLVLPTSLSSPMSLGYFFGDRLTYVDTTETLAEPQASLAELVPVNVPQFIDLTNIEADRFTPAAPSIIPEVKPAVTGPVDTSVISVTPLSWQGAVFLAWLTAVIAMVLLLLQRAIFVRGLVAQAKEASGVMADMLESCRSSISVKRKLGLKISPNAASPAVCGLSRPVILIPQNLASSLTTDQLRAVLLHELAHIKRGDLFVNLVQTVLQIIYFYNPLLWLANCIIRRIREQAVDEMVLVAMGEMAPQYPQTLVSVAKLAFNRPVLSLRLIGVVESQSALSARIKHILNRPMPKKAKLGIFGLLVVIIIGAILLPMASSMSGSPKLVIKGIVKDAQTDEPIARARVSDDGYGPEPLWEQIRPDVRCRWGAITNEAGQYSFLTWPEHHSIKVQAPGFKAQRRSLYSGHFTFNKKDEETFDFTLESEKASGSSEFKTTLPNGVTVELIGICEHPSDGKQWWRPDGRTIAKPYERLKFTELSEDSNLYEVVYRLLGSDDVLSSIYSNSEVSGHRFYQLNQTTKNLNIRNADNVYGAILFVKPDAQSIRLEIGAGRDFDWKTLCTQDSPVDKTGTTSPSVVFRPAIEKNGKTYTTIAHRIKDNQIRVVAVDNSGRLHKSEGFSNTANNEIGSCQARFNLPAEQIRSIQFQTQKFQRAIFKNVSLQPNFRTRVQAGIKSSRTIQAVPLAVFEYKLFEQLLDLVTQVEKQYPDQADHWPSGVGFYHVDAQGNVTVWNYRALWRRDKDCAPNEVGWGSSRLVNAVGMYYLPDGTPLQSRWSERGGGMKDIRVKIGRTVGKDERVPLVHRHSLPSDCDMFSRDGLERKILLVSLRHEPLAIIVRVDRPMRLSGWWLGNVESDVQHFTDYDQLIVTGPPGNIDTPMLVTIELPKGMPADQQSDMQAETEIDWVIEDYGQTRLLSDKEIPDTDNWVSVWASAVKNKGRYLVPNRGLTLKGLIKAAGYNKDKLAESYVELIRQSQEGNITMRSTYSRNLKTLLSGEESDIVIKIHDAVAGGYIEPSANGVEFWSGYHFNEIVEMTVNDDGAKVNMFADLDTGKLITPPDTLNYDDVNAVLRWIKDNGVDVMGETAPAVHGLVGFYMYAARVDNYFWDTNPLELTNRLMVRIDEPVLLSVENLLPVTYLIKTSKYKMGILQILRFTENPKGIKIRYKLLNKEAAPKPDVRTAPEPVSGDWQYIGRAIVPDFNDTLILTEHVNLGSIGRDAEGKTFITLFRDREKTKGRQYRFVLFNKAGDILEPDGHLVLGRGERLEEKFTFDEPFMTRRLKGFRFQARPLPPSGFDNISSQLQKDTSEVVKEETLLPSDLAPPGRYAVELDGVDDYLLAPDSTSLRLEPPFTIEMWVKTKLPPDASEYRGGWALISKGFTVGTPRAYLTGFGINLDRRPNEPSKLCIDFCKANHSGTYSAMYGGYPLTNGVSDWIHITHVFKGDHYKSTPGHPLVMGKFLIPTNDPFKGLLGEVRLWNGARTRQELREYENVALTGTEPGLVACWTFEQTKSQYAYDISSNNNHARLGKFTGTDDADPTWIDLQAPSSQPELKTDLPVSMPVKQSETQAVDKWVPLKIDYPEPSDDSYDPYYAKRIIQGKKLAEKPPLILVPSDVTNVAKGKPVTSTDAKFFLGELEYITDGDKRSKYFVEYEPKELPQHVTIDLEREYEIYAVVWWHCFDRPKVYWDVVVQVGRDAEFEDAVILFNSDHDGSLGLGKGNDLNYVETNKGWMVGAAGVLGRYVRLYNHTNTRNMINQYTEVEVYGRLKANRLDNIDFELNRAVSENSPFRRETAPKTDMQVMTDDGMDETVAKEMIEHIIDVDLSESARNCKYHSVSLGLGVVFCYGYFEIHRTDLLSLMDTSEKLPDASELGQNPFAIRQVEKALELSRESMEWWKPLTLDNRQYANKVIFSSPSGWGGYVGLAICTGEIRDDFMSVYLVYQAD